MAGHRELESYSPSLSHQGTETWKSGDFAPQEGMLGLAKVGAAGRDRDRDLQTVIETDIIPRLMLVHRNGIAKSDGGNSGRPQIEPSILAKFSTLVLEAPLDVLAAFVKKLADEGYSLKTILLDLCAPVARWLGDQWVADELDFVAVTLSLSRLQQLVHEIIPDYLSSRSEKDKKRILIVPTPGEQHSFGAVLATQLFRQSGWEVDGGLAVSPDELKDLVTRDSYAIVGFSQSSDVHLGNLIAAIKMIRQTAPVPPLAIIVGGRLAAERPDLCSTVDADLFVKDTNEAVEYSSKLVRVLGHASQ